MGLCLAIVRGNCRACFNIAIAYMYVMQITDIHYMVNFPPLSRCPRVAPATSPSDLHFLLPISTRFLHRGLTGIRINTTYHIHGMCMIKNSIVGSWIRIS